MAQSFYDEDLVIDDNDARERVSEAHADGYGESFHSQNRRMIPEEVHQTSGEIERLRQRQENLERRKQELNEQRRRIETFESNRRDTLDKLRRSAVLVVREGEQASRAAALCSEIGALFSRLHKEMESLRPDRWGEEEYDARLTEALAQIEGASNEYRRAMDKLNALGWNKAGQSGALGADPKAEERRGRVPGSFAGWLAVGFAFALPLALLACALILLYRFLIIAH